MTETKTLRRSGQLSYKKFYETGEAIKSAILNCGGDIIISSDVVKYLNNIGNPSSSTLVLPSSSSIQKRNLLEQNQTEKLEAPPQTSSKGKETLVLEKPELNTRDFVSDHLPPQISTVIPTSSSPSLHKRENSEDKTSSGPTPLPVKLEAPPQTSSSKGKGIQQVSDHLPAQSSTVIPTELYRNQMRRQGSSSFGSRPSSFDSSKRSRLESRSPSATSGKAIGIPHQQ
nr:hypothetical protein Iba_chr12aCG3580 [Ipomoea batatas]